MIRPKNELKGLIITNYGTVKNYANVNGIHEQKVYNIVKGKVAVNEETMKMFYNTLPIEATQIPYYFF